MSLEKMRKAKGFTLIELMIVVAIIGILAAVAIPKFADLVTKSKEAGVKGNLGSVRSAVSIYYGDTEGISPSTATLYICLTTGNKYMPSVQGLGDFSLPKNNAGNPGHTGGKVTSEGQITYTATPSDAGALGGKPLGYDPGAGLVWVDCTHNDTKNGAWSGY